MKILIIAILVATSMNAFADTADICRAAAETWALNVAGSESRLLQDTQKNSDGSYEVFTSKDEVDTEYQIGTTRSASGRSCKVTSHKIIDEQSG